MRRSVGLAGPRTVFKTLKFLKFDMAPQKGTYLNFLGPIFFVVVITYFMTHLKNEDLQKENM